MIIVQPKGLENYQEYANKKTNGKDKWQHSFKINIEWIGFLQRCDEFANHL
ncbi:hypothetical protein IH922_08080 [candidate division KSB1 bacterium]|nr:hypothetical protein [candidate division KSB1 bacterium]